MKKQLTITLVLMVTLLTTSCGAKKYNFHQVKKVPITNTTIQEPSSEVVYDQLYYDYEKDVEFTLFRSGDSYLLCRDNGGEVDVNWARVESEIPEEIKMKDFEFLHVKADLTLLNGGVAGLANAPVISKVYEQNAMSYDEVLEKKLIKKYDRSIEYFAGPRICENNGDTYIIVYCNYQKYRVYKNGKYMDDFTTAYAADGAMGLAGIDETAEYEKVKIYKLFVFKCKDTYLVYNNNKWTPILNEEYNNEIYNLTLKEGEMACIVNADTMLANGGKNNYENAIILRGYDNVDKCKYDIYTLYNDEQHWEANSPLVPLENECFEYKCGKYLIFNLDKKFYIYMDKESETDSPTLIGTYDTKSEVDSALGIE